MNVTGKFAEIGAKVVVKPGPLRIDVRREKGEEYFDIQTNVPLVVLDADPKDRHLVLMARADDASKPKFLCGFDERGWFVAPLPESRHVRWFSGTKPGSNRGVSTVETAKQALKPREVVESEEGKGLKRRDRNKRHNAASKRQGEWFFIPKPGLKVPSELILKKEPIQMGRKRKHMCAEVYRVGGEQVWVSRIAPNGLTDAEYRKLPERKQVSWNRMVREATVYARGAVSAPDHATLHLECWHQVVPNTEGRARHADRVAFLD